MSQFPDVGRALEQAKEIGTNNFVRLDPLCALVLRDAHRRLIEDAIVVALDAGTPIGVLNGATLSAYFVDEAEAFKYAISLYSMGN